MQFPNENELKTLREKYSNGAIVRLNSMDDPYHFASFHTDLRFAEYQRIIGHSG